MWGLVQRFALEQFPAQPYYLLGHSMGSFGFAQFLYQKNTKLAGAIIMGTTLEAPAKMTSAALLTKSLMPFDSKHGPIA